MFLCLKKKKKIMSNMELLLYNMKIYPFSENKKIQVFCWKSSNNSMKQCRWVYGRQVFMSDVALNGNEIMFVTQDGEAFSGKWLDEGKKFSEKKG